MFVRSGGGGSMSLGSNGSTFVPLYQRVVSDLKADIDTGFYEMGDKIPTEPQLCERFGVSRITIRRALDELVKAGYLIRRQGRGAFVTKPNVLRIIQRENIDTSMFSYSEACSACGYEPGAHCIMCRPVKAPITCQNIFNLCPSDDVLRVERVRTADGVPILVEINWFQLDSMGFLRDESLEDVSLFELIERRTGQIPMLHEPCTLEIVNASIEMAGELEVSAGEPLFCLAGRYFDGDGAPLFYGEQYIVGSRYSFTV